VIKFEQFVRSGGQKVSLTKAFDMRAYLHFSPGRDKVDITSPKNFHIEFGLLQLVWKSTKLVLAAIKT